MKRVLVHFLVYTVHSVNPTGAYISTVLIWGFCYAIAEHTNSSTQGLAIDHTTHCRPSTHNRGERSAVLSMNLPPFANAPSPRSHTLLHAARTDPILLTKLSNLLVSKCIVDVAFTTWSGYLENRDCVPQGERAPRPSNRANKREDYVENFIAALANTKTPTIVCNFFYF